MTDWASLKVVDLKAELSERRLSTKGLKADLVQRLIEDDAAAAQEDGGPVVEDKTEEEAAPPAIDNPPSDEIHDPQANIEKSDPAVATAIEDVILQAEAASDAQAQSEPHASQQLAPDANGTAQTDQNDQPALDTPLTVTDVVADLQKRKRRSGTPQPSIKRARQEEERLAEDREDVVDFGDNNNTFVSPKKSQNGVEQPKISPEDTNMLDEEQHMEVPATNTPTAGSAVKWESLEVTGEDAYAKRVAIAESSKLHASSAPQSRGLSRAGSEEDVYTKQTATAEPSRLHTASATQYPDLSVDESGEDASAKRVAIAESSKLQSTSLPQYVDERRHSGARLRSPQQEQEPYEYIKGDDRQPSQGIVKYEEDDASLPSSHMPTSALYIRELMRPLKSEAMEQYIVDLISSSANAPDTDPVQDFYLDQIRTHAFVRLSSISAARLVRAALHNQVWPNERNRKALFVDYIMEEHVKDWIDREESAPRGARWEVVYEQVGGSTVAIHREVGVDSKPFSRPPPTGPSAAGPTYPGIEGAPRGPRGGSGRSTFHNSNIRQTEVLPQLTYTPKEEDVAQRRIGNMRSFYAHDPPPDLGKDYHRFTFETADAFVDRGREVFIGIRPPHRQREHEERLERERLGIAGPSSVAESRRNDYRPAPRPSVTDEDRFSRYGGGRHSDRSDWPPRNRGFRSDRGPGRYRGEDPYRYRPGY